MYKRQNLLYCCLHWGFYGFHKYWYQKQPGKERDLLIDWVIGLTAYSPSSREVRAGTQVRLEPGGRSKCEEKHCLLSSSSWLQPDFSQCQGQPARCSHHPQWAGPNTSIATQENDAQVCPQASLMRTFSQLVLFFSQMTLACIKLT